MAIIISYPTSAIGIIVLLKTPPKYRKLDYDKNKKAQKITHKQGYTKVYKGTQGCTSAKRVIQGYIWLYKGIQGLTGVYKGTQGYTRVYISILE